MREFLTSLAIEVVHMFFIPRLEKKKEVEKEVGIIFASFRYKTSHDVSNLRGFGEIRTALAGRRNLNSAGNTGQELDHEGRKICTFL